MSIDFDQEEEKEEEAWLRQDMLVKLRKKRELHRQWEQGLASWEEYREAARLCRDGIRKAKAQLELNLARDAKNNKKGLLQVCQPEKDGQRKRIPAHERDRRTGNSR